MAYGSAFVDTITSSGNLSVTGNVTVDHAVNANVVGQLTGPVNGINMSYLIWDFGNIDNANIGFNAENLTSQNPRQLGQASTNYYYITIDAKNVQDFNNAVAFLDNINQEQYAWG